MPVIILMLMNENWGDELRDEVLSGSHAKKQAVIENDSEEEDESDEESPSIIATFREAIDCGNNLLHRKGRRAVI